MESTREALEALMSCGDCETCLAYDLCDDAPAIAEIALSLLDERDRYREALERLARLGNGGQYGNSDGNMIARAALKPAQKEAAHAEAGQ